MRPLQQRREDERDLPRLRTPTDDVPRQELLVGRVEDGDVNMWLPTVGGGHGTLEAKTPRTIGDDTAAPARPVAVRSRLPENDAGTGDRLAIGRP
jgi:hypothetical protein